jgi:hypothetical protein
MMKCNCLLYNVLIIYFVCAFYINQLMVLTSHGREAEALCNPFISHASHPTMYGKELKITSKGFGSSALEVTTPRGVCLSFLPGNREPLTEEVPGKTILVGNKVLLRRPERRTRS